MSQYTQRKQNDCLNCGAVVYGKYCHMCGQENIEPKETFWHLVTHFVYDLTHFDGKFFSTVKYLLLKPGYLSAEYIKGRRMRYLNPIKMYVFVSAFFFLFFFAIIHPKFKPDKRETEPPTYSDVKSKIESKIEDLQKNIKDKENADYVRKIMQKQVGLLQHDLQTLTKDTAHLTELNYFQQKGLSAAFGQYSNVAQYDSAQNSLPAPERNGWLERVAIKKGIELQSKYNYDDNEFFKTLFEKFRHSFPQLFFVLLPLFALLLKMLYFKKRTIYYVDHLIYAVHLYCAMFILLFIILNLDQVQRFQYFHWLSVFTVPLVIYAIWYQYKSLRNFYEQSRLKTVVKYLLLLIMSSVVMSVLFIGLLVLSVFNL